MTTAPGRPLASSSDTSSEPIDCVIALLVHAAGLHEDDDDFALARSHLAHARDLARFRTLQQPLVRGEDPRT